MADTLFAENPAVATDFNYKFYEKFYEGSVVDQKQSQSLLIASTTSLSKISLMITSNSPTVATSGELRVSVYAADVNHKPTGAVLGYTESSATFSGTSWRDFIFSPTLSLSPALYAFVLTAVNMPLPASPNSFSYSVGATYLSDNYVGGKQHRWSGVWNNDAATMDLRFKAYKAPSMPTEVTGAVTIEPNSGSNIDFSANLTVTPTGDLTLDVTEVGNLTGDKTITVQPGGKIKLTTGRQVTVSEGTLYKLLT